MLEKIVVGAFRLMMLMIVVVLVMSMVIPIGCAIGDQIESVSDSESEQEIYIELEEPTPAPTQTERKSENFYTDDVPMSYGYQCAMQDACRMYDVPYSLALGIAEVESSFDFEAYSGYAWGIMQINPINYEWLMEEGIDATTYSGNIKAGVFMIGQLLQKYDVHKALMAYNCGESCASRLWEEGYDSSQYSRAVVAAAERWEEVIG